MDSKGLASLAVAIGLTGSLSYLVAGCMEVPRRAPVGGASSPAPEQHSGPERPVTGRSVAICLEASLSQEVYEAAASALEEAYEMTAFRGPELSVPQNALDARRGQYLAEAVLAYVPLPENAEYSLGIVRGDLCTPGLNFVFGMAQGRRALISIRRLQAGERGRVLFLRRVAVEAVHELGHLLGLGHCSDLACAMFFSTTLADTDRKGTWPCRRCRAILEGTASK